MELMLLRFVAAPCPGGSFLGFPKWYKYLDSLPSAAGVRGCTPKISQLSDVWLIVMAVIDLLLRVAALAAIIFVIYGAVQLMTSQGEPDRVNKGRQSILNALGGLAICIVAITIVSYVAGRLN